MIKQKREAAILYSIELLRMSTEEHQATRSLHDAPPIRVQVMPILDALQEPTVVIPTRSAPIRMQVMPINSLQEPAVVIPTRPVAQIMLPAVATATW